MSADSTEKSEYISANNNPWYCLATLQGEQEKNACLMHYDPKLAEENRKAEPLVCRDLERRTTYRSCSQGFSQLELKRLSAKDREDFYAKFLARAGQQYKPPDPNERIFLAGTRFERFVSLRGFLFPNVVLSTLAKYVKEADFSSAVFFSDTEFNQTTFSEESLLRVSDIVSTDLLHFSGIFQNRQLQVSDVRRKRPFP